MNNKSYSPIAILVLILSFSLSIQAQDESCGTEEFMSPGLIEFQSLEKPWMSSRAGEMIYVKTVCHIVGKDDSTGFINMDAFFQQACETFSKLETYGISLYISDINFIKSTKYYNHETTSLGAEMMNEHKEEGAMNLFFVSNPAGYCGYYSRGPDCLVVGYNCMRPSAYTWAHELGHMFSLPHTFAGWGEYEPGKPAPRVIGNRETELVARTNCYNAGDGFCDTPPDFLNSRWPCDADSMSLLQLIDADGVKFHADGRLIMSYSQAGCRGMFSEEQAEAMRYNILVTRGLDVSEPDLPEIKDFSINNISPALEEELYFDDVTFSWDPVEGAVGYLLEYSALPDFKRFSTVVYLTEPFYVPDTIYPNWTNIIWRVKPYGLRTTCVPDFSEVYEFTVTTETTSTNNTELDRSIEIYPNPLRIGDDLTIKTPNGFEGIIKIFDVTGSLVYGSKVQGNNGFIKVESHNFTSGLHFIRLDSEKHSSSHKVLFRE